MFHEFQMFQRHRSIGVPGFLIALAVTCLAQRAHGQQPSTEFDGPGYRVQLPNGTTGVTEARIDFSITTFKKADGNVLLSAYASLHPNFSERGSRTDRFNGLNAKRLEWPDSEKKKCSEVLVTIRGSRQFTFSVHFWYCLASEADLKLAESIIRSIRAEP